MGRVHILAPKLKPLPRGHDPHMDVSQRDFESLAATFELAINHPMSMYSLSFEDGYKKCYFLTINKRGDELYAFLKRVVRRSRSCPQPAREKFQVLVKGWALYLDRTYCQRHRLTPICDFVADVRS